MEEITQLISNVGFPIMACIFMYKREEKLTSIINDLSTTLKGIDVRLEGLEDKIK